jgi:hypothetical protein
VTVNFSAFERFSRAQVPGEARPSVEAEEQNSDYESGVALIGDERWRIRTARVTATKPGAFVAVWKRSEGGETRPFRMDESLTGLLVFVVERNRFGVFRFTAAQLVSLGYVTSELHAGKRGFRVYPAWCSGLNSQATRTQRAQAAAFFEQTSPPD